MPGGGRGNEVKMRIRLEEPLRFLRPDQISLIDSLLKDVAPFGEVRLRVQEGDLRSAMQSKSYDAYKLSRPLALRRPDHEKER